MWFKTGKRMTAAQVFPQIGAYGSHPVFLRSTGGDGWHVNCKLPPGLSPGWHHATLRTQDSEWGNRVRIGVDLSAEDRKQLPGDIDAAKIRIAVVTDGRTWERSLIRTGLNACLSLWASGLPESVAEAAITVRLGDRELPAVFLSEADPQGLRQVNAILPQGLPPGDWRAVAVRVRESVSEAVAVKLI